jgi:hypothetical protein
LRPRGGLRAAVAQSASADTGQTIFECTEESLTTKTFSDAHCVNTTGTLKFGHVVLPEGQKIQAKVNNSFTADDTISATPFVAKIEHLHGFSNVTITCAEVTGSGKALNILDGSVHEATGTGEAFFRKGISENCTTNQTGCSAAVGLIKAQVEAVEGLAPGITGMGLRFKPLSPATSFGTVTFEGTCGLSAFGAIPIKGSTIATARGEATGRGATAYFLEGEMNSLTIGAEKAEITGRLVFTRTSTGWPLVLTTSPFAGDQ